MLSPEFQPTSGCFDFFPLKGRAFPFFFHRLYSKTLMTKLGDNGPLPPRQNNHSLPSPGCSLLLDPYTFLPTILRLESFSFLPLLERIPRLLLLFCPRTGHTPFAVFFPFSRVRTKMPPPLALFVRELSLLPFFFFLTSTTLNTAPTCPCLARPQKNLLSRPPKGRTRVFPTYKKRAPFPQGKGLAQPFNLYLFCRFDLILFFLSVVMTGGVLEAFFFLLFPDGPVDLPVNPRLEVLVVIYFPCSTVYFG